MSNQYSAKPIDSSDSDSDRLRTLLDNLNNLKSKLQHFTVIDELGQPIGEITDLILDASHQLNLVISLPDAAAVLLNGRRIKKVSVQTQSVFVDITKADTQFLPEYSPSEGTPSLEASEQPLHAPFPSETFPNLTFSEDDSFSENAIPFNEEHPSQPTVADLELAKSLFDTEPDTSNSVETSSLAQDWELSNQNQPEDVFAEWGETAESSPASFSFENASSPDLANELEHLDLQLDNDWSELGAVSAAEDTSNTFDLDLDLEPLAPESPDLNLDLEPLTQESSALDVSEEALLSTEPLSFDESTNPFAEALPDFGVDAGSAASEELSDLDWGDTAAEQGSPDFVTASGEELPDLDWADGTTHEESPDFTTAASEELSNLDWSDETRDDSSMDFTTAAGEELPDLDWADTASHEELPDFTLEDQDLSFDLPTPEASDGSENAFLESQELEPEPFSETPELVLEDIDFSADSSLQSNELVTDSLPELFEVPEERSDRWDEWDDTSQVLDLEESTPSSVSEEMSLDNLAEPSSFVPNTIHTLADLDIAADNADNNDLVGDDLVESTPTSDELIDQPSDQRSDSSFDLEPIDFQSNLLEQPSDDLWLNGSLNAAPAEESFSSSTSHEQDTSPEPLAVNEPENHDEWLATAGVGAAGLAAGLASSSSGLNQEPLESSSEEAVKVPAQPVEEIDAMLPLLEEQLNVEYQRRKVGEVIIRKQIETRMVQVPVRYEKLVIEQVSPERKSLAEVDLSQGALDNIELTGVDEKPKVAGEFASPAVASQALEAIAKALQNRCKRVRIEIELEDGKLQQAYQEWLDQCSQL